MKRLAHLQKGCLQTTLAVLGSLRLSESFPGQESLDGSSRNSQLPAKPIDSVNLFSGLLSSGLYQPLRQTPLMILERLDTARGKDYYRYRVNASSAHRACLSQEIFGANWAMLSVRYTF